MALLANSVPLSTVIDTGAPRAAITCDSANATFWPVSELSARSNRHSRVNWDPEPASIEQPGGDKIHRPLFVRPGGPERRHAATPRDFLAHLGPHCKSVLGVQAIDALGV